MRPTSSACRSGSRCPRSRPRTATTPRGRSTWRSWPATPGSRASSSCRPPASPACSGASMPARAPPSASTSCTTSSSSYPRSGARRRSKRKLVEKEGLGTVCMGRGAVNQKGPENSFLSALMAFKAAGKKLPVNLVLVCEGEEEIGSPHFGEVVMNPEVLAELKKCVGLFMPEAGQDRDGGVQVNLGAKGVVELELVSTGEKWGRGPAHDVHSSLEAAGRLPDLAPGAGAQHARQGRRPHPGGGGVLREGAAAVGRAEEDGRGARRQDRRGDPQEEPRRAALGARCELGRVADAARVAAHHQHRGPGGRLHRPGRQDGAAAPRGGQDRHAASARHDRRRHARQTQGTPGQARLRRHRGQHVRRLRPEPDRQGQPPDPDPARHLSEGSAPIRSCGRARPARGRATCSRTRR